MALIPKILNPDCGYILERIYNRYCRDCTICKWKVNLGGNDCVRTSRCCVATWLARDRVPSWVQAGNRRCDTRRRDCQESRRIKPVASSTSGLSILDTRTFSLWKKTDSNWRASLWKTTSGDFYNNTRGVSKSASKDEGARFRNWRSRPGGEIQLRNCDRKSFGICDRLGGFEILAEVCVVDFYAKRIWRISFNCWKFVLK